jgi:ATP-dependent DNA helicase RecQ
MRKLLHCVYSIRKVSGFGVGLKHVAEVLTGARTEKVKRLGHEHLEAYARGNEHSRAEWAAIGRQLIQMGYLRQSPGRFVVLELTADGLEALKTHRPVMLARPAVTGEPPSRNGSGAIRCDELLFERLRRLRRRLADERDVPAFVVFSDVALHQMAHDYPANEREFLRVSGVGERKLREFGRIFLAEIAGHLENNPRLSFADSASQPGTRPRARLGESGRETLASHRAGRTVEEIAAERGLARSTIFGHLAEAIEWGEEVDLGRFLTPVEEARIADAFSRLGFGNLAGVKELLGDRFDYGLLRMYRSVHQNRSSPGGR